MEDSGSMQSEYSQERVKSAKCGAKSHSLPEVCHWHTLAVPCMHCFHALFRMCFPVISQSNEIDIHQYQ